VESYGWIGWRLEYSDRGGYARDLTLKGKWMYSRQDVKDLIKMTEIGVLKLGDREAEKFALKIGKKGFEAAFNSSATGKGAIIVP